MEVILDRARENMIKGQLCPNKVTDLSLIEALIKVPREVFVPRHLQHIAYADEDIDLGNGRYLAETRVLARLIQAAEIKKSDVVLDIGCGTGYSAALLGQLAGTVVGVEENQRMAEEADKLLHDLDICNAVVVHKNTLQEGYAQQGPYNVILLNGSVPAVPERIRMQLAEGGKLVTVLSRDGHMGSAIMMLRSGDHFSTRVLFDAAMPVLAGFKRKEGFVF
jgi:protein-L-isoaspartate(D-aspartate) O-methyltransferase